MPKIVSSPAYKNDSLLIITFDQLDETAAAGAPAIPPLQVGTLLVSPFVSPGATDGAAYNPYSLLASAEDLFGLSRVAEAGRRKVHSFAAPLLEESGGGE